jgi:rRNA-processing protein FCF1
MTTIVLLDSNFIFAPLQFTIDIYEEIPKAIEGKCTMIVLSGVKQEIVSKNTRLKDRAESKLGVAALQLLAKKVGEGRVTLLQFRRNTGEPVDDYIIRAGVRIKEDPAEFFQEPVENVAIATNDLPVKKKSHAAGLLVLHVREKHRVVLASG